MKNCPGSPFCANAEGMCVTDLSGVRQERLIGSEQEAGLFLADRKRETVNK